MPTPVRELIIQQFVDQAQLLTPEVVERVRRSKLEQGLLFVSVWDGRETLVEQLYNGEYRSLVIGLEIAWIPTENPSEEVSHVMAEAYQTMMAHRYEGVEAVYFQSSIPNYPDDGQNPVMIRMEFEVRYKIRTADPYTFVE